MRKTIASLILAGAMGVSGLASAAPIQGAPLDQPTALPGVITVAGGCGIGFHRGPYGGCRRNVVIRRPVVRRRCHWVIGRYGRRRWVCYR